MRMTIDKMNERLRQVRESIMTKELTDVGWDLRDELLEVLAILDSVIEKIDAIRSPNI